MKQIIFYMFMMIMMMLLVMLLVLLSVAFLTLFERNMLGSIHIRKGPNKIMMQGVFQPFSDALKLLSKELSYMYKCNYLLYMFSPMFMLILILMMWMLYPYFMNYMLMIWGFIYLMCCFSLGVYGVMMSGWSSNSSYSMLGSIRSLAQSISYEVSLFILMIMPMFMIESLNLNMLILFQMEYSFYIILMSLGMIFFFSILVELNRAPFDFSEGESELVSGFNLEFSSSSFVLIFLSEYASILFLSFLYVIFFWGGSSMGDLEFYLKIIFTVICVIWVRGTFPRFRYDLLMYFCWMMILPIILNFMIFVIFLKVYMNYN